MEYKALNLPDGVVFKAEHLNYIERGILDLFERVKTLEAKARAVTFYVDGTPYTADAGMTWGQFIESSNNKLILCEQCMVEIKAFTEADGLITHNAGDGCYGCTGSWVEDREAQQYVKLTDEIIVQHAYYSNSM